MLHFSIRKVHCITQYINFNGAISYLRTLVKGVKLSSILVYLHLRCSTYSCYLDYPIPKCGLKLTILSQVHWSHQSKHSVLLYLRPMRPTTIAVSCQIHHNLLKQPSLFNIIFYQNFQSRHLFYCSRGRHTWCPTWRGSSPSPSPSQPSAPAAVTCSWTRVWSTWPRGKGTWWVCCPWCRSITSRRRPRSSFWWVDRVIGKGVCLGTILVHCPSLISFIYERIVALCNKR